MSQMNLLDPVLPSRRAARAEATKLSRARGERMAGLAAEKVDALHTEWCAQALQKLRELAKRCYPGAFTIETARLAINFPVPEGGDLRSWGKVTTDALKLGYIEPAVGRSDRAASSNGAFKRMYRAGKNA